MSTHRSRTADPLPGVEPATAIGTWGMWLTAVVLGTGVAGLATAALYLHSGQPAWPPEGLVRPDRGRALLAVLVAAVAAAAAWTAVARLARASVEGVGWPLLGSLAATLTAAWLLVADLRAVPFAWDVHAYTSVYWVLTGAGITMLVVGALLLAAVLAQHLVGIVDPERMLELQITAGYLTFAFLATTALLALVHYLPSPGGTT